MVLHGPALNKWNLLLLESTSGVCWDFHSAGAPKAQSGPPAFGRRTEPAIPPPDGRVKPAAC